MNETSLPVEITLFQLKAIVFFSCFFVQCVIFLRHRAIAVEVHDGKFRQVSRVV